MSEPIPVVHIEFDKAANLGEVNNALLELNKSSKLGLNWLESNSSPDESKWLIGLTVRDISKFLNKLGSGKTLQASNGVNITRIQNPRQWKEQNCRVYNGAP